jgi:bifunctional NMN adenylyltransferase/nudix hydrolase
MLPGVGVVIGRFQVPALHAGHKSVLDAAKQHSNMLILIGVSKFDGYAPNPLEYKPREDMIYTDYEEASVMPIADCRSDLAWSQEVDRLIDLAYPDTEVTFYYGRDSFKDHYLGKHTKVVEVDNGNLELSGTAIRAKVAESLPKEAYHEAFKKGAIYVTERQWPVLIQCVDIALYCKENDSVLVGLKNDDPLYRFPGGIVDVADPCLEFAATRELAEETKVLATGFKYLGSYKVNDWRAQHGRIEFMTSLFVTECLNLVEPEAGDDLKAVAWLPVSELNGDRFIHEHGMLVERLLMHLQKGL